MARTAGHLAAGYDRAGHGIPGDVAFYVTLAEAAAAPVLELGCGTGRVTLALARAGVTVVGLDNDATMLDQARRKAGNVANPAWVEADMRTFALGQRFGQIVIPYRSLQLMGAVAACGEVLGRVAAHLLPGGSLAFNVSNVPALVRQMAATAERQMPLIRRGELLPLDAGQVRSLLERAGFTVVRLCGGFDGEPFTMESSEQVWIASLSQLRSRPRGTPDR